MNHGSKMRHLGALAGAMLLAPWVFAAEVGPDTTATDQSNNLSLEEVVVTARRREESLKSVPVSETAITAQALREKSIETTQDLQITTPGVYLSGSGGNENVVYQIRGQSKALSGPSS